MSDLYHLAYLSQSTLGDNQVFIRNEVEQILAAADAAAEQGVQHPGQAQAPPGAGPWGG